MRHVEVQLRMTRSLALEQKLAKHLQSKAWKALLSDMPAVEVLSFDVTDRDFSEVQTRCRDTWYIAAQPDSALRDTYDERTNNEVVSTWMVRVMTESKMLDAIANVPFYLCAETSHAAGWTAVRSSDVSKAIPELFHRLTQRMITIADASLGHTLVFRTTEHFWHAYWTWPVKMQRD